jgi:hypothetical protein
MGSSETDHAATRPSEHLAEPFTVKCAHGQAVAIVVLYDAKPLHDTVGATRGRRSNRGRVLLRNSQGSKNLLLNYGQRVAAQVVHIYLPPLVILGQK